MCYTPCVTCSVDGCQKQARHLGWCVMHWARQHRTGSLELVIVSFEERFWSKVDKRGSDECWPWIASIDPYGYGAFATGRAHGYYGTAHRTAYALLIGPIPEGLTIDHTCHNESSCIGGVSCVHRRCCNPNHLEAVPRRVNVLRGKGSAAINANKTHCPQGHPYDAANTKRPPSGGRRCRICDQASHKRWRAKKRKQTGIVQQGSPQQHPKSNS